MTNYPLNSTTIFVGDYFNFHTSKEFKSNEERTKHLKGVLRRRQMMSSEEIKKMNVVSVVDMIFGEEWIVETN